jgi:hypothetical protein
MTKNKGKEWSNTEVQKLKTLAKSNTNTGMIAKNLGRTVNAIYTKASQENISLKPKD